MSVWDKIEAEYKRAEDKYGDEFGSGTGVFSPERAAMGGLHYDDKMWEGLVDKDSLYADTADPFELAHEGPATRDANAAAEAAISTQTDASKYAADQQRLATREIIESTEKGRDQARADLEPWRTTGGEAVNTLAEKVAAGPGDYTQSPGYDFRLAEGQKRIERGAAARGDVLDPATGKALVRYGQDYATGDYDNFLRRYYDSLTPLQSLSGVGLTGAGGSASASQTAAGRIGAAYQNQADTLGTLATSTASTIGNIGLAQQANAAASKDAKLGAIGTVIGAIF